ncbi:MAG: hypothetical protein H7332_13085 [Bdellovibrionales bacterium]|nr:hypothetical protein [Ramlibacter sp.]
MKQLNRANQAVADQKAAFSQFRPAVADEQSTELLRFYDSFDGAVSGFILSELNMRQGDRCKALNVFSDLQAHSYKQGAEYNLRALGHLANAQAFLWKFRKNLPEPDTATKSFAQRLDDVRHEMREVICELEIKASDAAELSVTLDHVCTLFRRGACEAGIFVFIDGGIKSLEALRKTPGRGAESNIAAWKLHVAQILLALAVWVAYKCFHVTCRCAQIEKSVHGAILAVASVVHVA